jgi:hypothetical protein
MAPVAPEIIPGRPPNIEVTSPIIKAPYKPTIGDIPATKAKATASGTKAKATVNPERISFFTLPPLEASIKSNVFTDQKLAAKIGYNTSKPN